jgi:hypothetical protein
VSASNGENLKVRLEEFSLIDGFDGYGFYRDVADESQLVLKSLFDGVTS